MTGCAPSRIPWTPSSPSHSVAVIGAADRPGSVSAASSCGAWCAAPAVASCILSATSAPACSESRPTRALPTGPSPSDLAVVVTPAPTVPQIIGDCVEAGVADGQES
jgi:acetyltransferase